MHVGHGPLRIGWLVLSMRGQSVIVEAAFPNYGSDRLFAVVEATLCMAFRWKTVLVLIDVA